MLGQWVVFDKYVLNGFLLVDRATSILHVIKIFERFWKKTSKRRFGEIYEMSFDAKWTFDIDTGLGKWAWTNQFMNPNKTIVYSSSQSHMVDADWSVKFPSTLIQYGHTWHLFYPSL